MIDRKAIKLAVSGLLCFAAAGTLSAQIEYDRQNFFEKPYIKASFLGSYEIDTKLEPKLNEEEQLLLKELLELIKTPEGRDTALARVEAAITPESSAALPFFAANFYAEKGNIEQAKRYYKDAVKRFPNFRRAMKNLAIMHVKDGEYEEAKKLFTKTIELGAKDTTTMGLLGLCYVNSGQAISAETAYREAIVLDPSVNDWRVGLAKSLLMQQKYQEAVAVLEEILIEDPTADVIWASQANAFIGLDKPELAVANHEIIHRMGKSTADSLNLMGNIYMSRNLNELALKYFLEAIEKDPNQPIETHIDTASIMIDRGSFEEASTIIDNIRANYRDRISQPQETQLLRLESRIAMATGTPDEFIPILDKLVENDPLDGEALMMLADYYSSLDTQEGYAKADIYYDRVIKIPEMQVQGLISKARSYVARERFGDAIPLLERAQTLEPKPHIGRYLEQVRKINLAKLGL